MTSTGMGRTRVYARLQELAADGLAAQISRGRWTVTGKPRREVVARRPRRPHARTRRRARRTDVRADDPTVGGGRGRMHGGEGEAEPVGVAEPVDHEVRRSSRPVSRVIARPAWWLPLAMLSWWVTSSCTSRPARSAAVAAAYAVIDGRITVIAGAVGDGAQAGGERAMAGQQRQRGQRVGGPAQDPLELVRAALGDLHRQPQAGQVGEAPPCNVAEVDVGDLALGQDRQGGGQVAGADRGCGRGCWWCRAGACRGTRRGGRVGARPR